MPHQRSAIWTGGLLIIVGALFLAINLLEIEWRNIWPLFFFAVAAVNLLIFLSNRRNYGVLMPATIMVVYGILFQYCAVTGWWRMAELWPLFILGPGMGFLMMYLFGKREPGLLVPAFILIGISTVFLLTFGPFRYYSRFWPVILIIAGLLLLLRRKPQAAKAPE